VALPTATDLKSYLRIETNAEDALLAALMARAKSMLEAWIDVPITAESQTAVDRATTESAPIKSLLFPRRPITQVSVTDGNGVIVDAMKYSVDSISGMIYGKTGITFPDGPYTITAMCGLSLMPNYTRLEPILSECIIDIAADLYERRTPGASSETAAGTSISWDVSRETIARIMKTLRTLKLPIVL
jgi:uncharacterized phiE125 gp8 family phage protein